MSANPEFINYIKDLFEPLESIKHGSFFGGFAFKSGQKQFAMIMGNTLYFCVNSETRQKYQDIQMQPFSYKTKKGIVLVQKYYSAPEDLLDDPEEMILWAQEAIVSAYTY